MDGRPMYGQPAPRLPPPPAPAAMPELPALGSDDRAVICKSGVADLIVLEPDGSEVRKSLAQGEIAVIEGARPFSLRHALGTGVEVHGGQTVNLLRNGQVWRCARPLERPKPQAPRMPMGAWLRLNGDRQEARERLASLVAARDELSKTIAALERQIGDLSRKVEEQAP